MTVTELKNYRNLKLEDGTVALIFRWAPKRRSWRKKNKLFEAKQVFVLFDNKEDLGSERNHGDELFVTF